jgi:hypothetical protein
MDDGKIAISTAAEVCDRRSHTSHRRLSMRRRLAQARPWAGLRPGQGSGCGQRLGACRGRISRADADALNPLTTHSEMHTVNEIGSPPIAGQQETKPGWRPVEVHPLAELFPPLAPDDLAALAADIRANGLLHPIVIDANGRLIDGRMRLAACEQAGVEPTFTRLSSQDDPETLIWSANTKRRQMTKSQIAMIAAAGLSKKPRAGQMKVKRMQRMRRYFCGTA